MEYPLFENNVQVEQIGTKCNDRPLEYEDRRVHVYLNGMQSNTYNTIPYYTMMRVRFPLLLLLGIVFLASVSASFVKQQDEPEQPRPYPYPRPHQPHQKEHGSEESESQRSNNPFYFSSNKFHTIYENKYGHIRLLQRFEKRSTQLENLRDYRVAEFKSKPNTLLLPHHADADFMLVVLSGRAILTLVNTDNVDSYNLESAYAQRIPAGTTFYLVNPDDNDNLRVICLAMPVNKPGRYEDFFLSNTEEQQSYLQGFSKNFLEASYDTNFEEINRVLFGEKQNKQEGVIVQLSKEQIRELSRHAKPISRKTISPENEPINVRSGHPIYSNKLGQFYEITPENNPQLRNLDISLSSVDINEGALLLPHYNSKSIVILVVNEGKANIELVGLREQQEDEETKEVQRYRAELSEDDVFVIPADYPVAIEANSNMNLLGFGINAENNQRNFLAGKKDNVVRQVSDIAFPGSAQDVEKLLNYQKESYFADAQPSKKEKEGKGPLPSILGALY
ncbi:Beta-conglycinin, beta chain, partial [Mucuna pruriens]